MTDEQLLTSMESNLGLDIASASVKGAYMQSDQTKRELYVRPAKQVLSHNFVYNLSRLPYGIVGAGCQRPCVTENWMVQKNYMLVTNTFDYLFYKWKEANKISIFVAKVVDDFLLSRRPPQMIHSISDLNFCSERGQIKSCFESSFSNVSSLCCWVTIIRYVCVSSYPKL